MVTTILLISGLLLAFANGGNDNVKGVATLFGSGTTDYRRALYWATGTTLIGSFVAVLIAQTLLARFSGKGLVPDELAASPHFLAAVGMGAGLAVVLATRIGMPISTTHALVGALVGAGAAAAASVHWGTLGAAFFAPLLLSPVLALVATAAVYPVFRAIRVGLGVGKQSCFCVGLEPVEIVPLQSPAAALERSRHLTLTLGTTVTCHERYEGQVLGVNCRALLDALHYLSAGLVSFARGLNDTPKIAALMLAAPSIGTAPSIMACGVVIAAGGLTSGRRVAETMGRRITPMNAGQGFTANLMTGLLVIGASRFGLPVSTTHVSCGSLFGLGAVTGGARRAQVVKIVLAWVVTLPVAATLAWGSYQIVSFGG
ncbi:inorganic phosphate transporter [Tautonia sociabilis]|uniref:Phosphate transporter n=1 Tax=Tautonia sociabilis TaxID=2080755 RepID=A0A432ML12_9BACT|nr:inorganic phosphate transporter [Tautonia sociabilis]RUL87949.1 inorganic phosphate transporter [Tautonia sociabilis]